VYLSKSIIVELCRVVEQIRFNIDNAVVSKDHFKLKTVNFKEEFFRGSMDALNSSFSKLDKLKNSITDVDEYMNIKKNVAFIYDEIANEKYKLESKLSSCKDKSRLESYLTGYISGILTTLNMLNKLFSIIAKGELNYANKNKVS